MSPPTERARAMDTCENTLQKWPTLCTLSRGKDCFLPSLLLLQIAVFTLSLPHSLSLSLSPLKNGLLPLCIYAHVRTNERTRGVDCKEGGHSVAGFLYFPPLLTPPRRRLSLLPPKGVVCDEALTRTIHCTHGKGGKRRRRCVHYN